MKFKFFIFYLFSLTLFSWCSVDAHLFFVQEQEKLDNFQGVSTIMIASPGRSGSTLMAAHLHELFPNLIILKTHILPPKQNYSGKILFIFSNPDKAAESALHLTIKDAVWGLLHFQHVKSSDLHWLSKIGDTTQQNLENNFLSYDALGCARHLYQWLYRLKESQPQDAQVLAIKYEDLWSDVTIQAIQDFLNLPTFSLPPKKERGYQIEELEPREILFKNMYNLGTPEEPRYKAYDIARYLWQRSPSIKYLKLY